VILVVLLLGLGASTNAIGQRLSIADALDLYNRGEHLRARAAVSSTDLGPMFVKLTTEADKWIKAGTDAERPRRLTVAAAFAIDVVSTHQPVILTGSTGVRMTGDRLRGQLFVIAWACQLPKSTPPSTAEYWWFMASVEMFVQTSQWDDLTGRPRSGYADPVLGSFAAASNERQQGHLWHAKARFPDELRWRRVTLQRAEEEFRDFGRLKSEKVLMQAPTLRFDELSEASVQMLTGPPSTEKEKIVARDVWSSLRSALDDLADDPNPDLRAEARLHAAYWRMCLRDWQGALEQLATIELRTDRERFLIPLFRGWSLQRLGRTREASDAYRLALERAPRAQSATTLLAPIELLDGRREEAYRLLDAAFSGPDAAPDPWIAFRFGEPDRLSLYLDNLRKALQ